MEDVNLDDLHQNLTTYRKEYIGAKGICAFPGWYADETAPGTSFRPLIFHKTPKCSHTHTLFGDG